MGKIVIEVDDYTAKTWKLTSLKRRKILSSQISEALYKTLSKDSKIDFITYLDELRDKMEERGLTQEALDEILNDG